MAKKKFFKKPKPEKIHLTFDSKDRKEFLTGFQKRKTERRLKAKQELDKELKEEKCRIKQKQKERLNDLYDSQRNVPEVEHLLDPTITYDLPKHLVNITTFDANHISGLLGMSLGINKTNNNNNIENKLKNNINNDQNIANQSNDSNDSDSDVTKDLNQKIIDTKKSVKKQRIDSIKSSKAFQTQQKLKRNKDVLKSKLRRKQLKKDMKQMKTKSLNKKKSSNKKKNMRKNMRKHKKD